MSTDALTPERPPRLRRRLRRPGAAASKRLNVLSDQGTATTIDHLEELRWRIIAVALWLAVAFAVAYVFRDILFTVLNRPLGGEYRIQTLGVTEPFFTTLTVAANAAFVAIVPIIVYNVWRYVAPALTPAQRRSMRPVLLATPLLFIMGVVFCYFFVLTPAIHFLLGFGSDNFDVTVRAKDYYSFASMTLLAMGAIFLFPLVLLGLGRVGIITASLLRAKRRLAYILIAVAAALLPTADPVSLMVEIIPLAVLYELSITMVALQERSLRRAAERGVVEDAS